MPVSITVLHSGLWTREERQLHIKVLEHLEYELLGQSVLIESDTSSHQQAGGSGTKTLNNETYTLFQ